MGHPCYGRIEIGGNVPASLKDELIEQIVKELGPLERGNLMIGTMPEEGAVFSADDPEACYGHFNDLEEWLINHRIHFDVVCGSDPEWDSGLWQYRGEDPKPEQLDEDGTLLGVDCAMEFERTDTNGFRVWRWKEIELAVRKVWAVIKDAIELGEADAEENAINLLKLELKADGKPALKPLRFVDVEKP